MRHNQIQLLKSEIATFADDVDEVLYGQNGEIMFNRLGNAVTLQFVQDNKGGVRIRYNSNDYTYKGFLAKELAHLEQFANKIKQHDDGDEEVYYVDPDAVLITSYSKYDDKAIDILKKQCDEPSWDGTKVAFVTADAGHGKTFLLRQFQRKTAEAYLNGESEYLFWHIDLHGRDLVRLNEAIMYELGELRISGLYYNSILTLIKNGLIILGIDGFDELSAEKGGDAALGSLTNLVFELEGDGKLVAASRRTFFNTQDYIIRTGIMNQKAGSACEFDEIRLKNWGEKECVNYLDIYYQDPRDKYLKLKSLFKTSISHPLLERPFLFTKIVKMANEAGITPYDFASHGGDTDLDSTNNIIKSFVEREVDKWSLTEKDSGKPYLTFDQHIRLLSDIANEMWLGQKDYISIDTISYILAILFDEWGTEADLKPKIARMAESHALLPIATAGDRFRKFDHEEFKYFFLALSLERMLKQAVGTGNYSAVKTFMKIAQFSDSVGHYLVMQLTEDETRGAISGLISMVANDWRSTYVQPNLGTILPFFFDRINNNEVIEVSNKIAFSSVVMENKHIKNIRFKECSFINISFKNTFLENVEFNSCSFTNIKISKYSNNTFDKVFIKDDCVINQVTIIDLNEEAYSEYSPQNIDYVLSKHGIIRGVSNTGKASVKNSHAGCAFRKLVKQFLNKYNQATYQYEKSIREHPASYSRKPDEMLNEVIPMLLNYHIIEEVSNRNTQQADTKAWKLSKYSLPEIYKAEEAPNSELYKFWEDVYLRG